MRRLGSDIEAIGFYDVIKTKDDIHCLCSIDVDTDEVFLFHNYPEYDNAEVYDPHDRKTYIIPARAGTLEEGFQFWIDEAKKGSQLIVHNAMTYDKPVFDKVHPGNDIPMEAWKDTLVQSKVQWFERPTPKGCKGAHGLQAWGARCGISKPEITDWSTMDVYKLHRVVEDCKIQVKTFLMLEQEREKLLESFGIDFRPAIKIESMYAYEECFQQEQRGALVDQEHIRECIVELDGFLEELANEIEPQLPLTVKARGSGKVSRKEMAALMGYNPDKVQDTYVQKKVDGVLETVVEKPYHKPTVNYTKVDKTNSYSGSHVSYGYSPSYIKKKDLTDWIKENYPDTKPKDWGIEKEVIETPLLNKTTCEFFDLKPEDTDIVVGPHTKVDFEPSRMTQNAVVKGFLIRLGWRYAEEWNLKKDHNDQYIKAEVDTEVRWPPKAAPENQLVRVVKAGELIVSSPKLEEDDYDQLPEGVGQKIAEYNTYKHRRGFLSNVKDPENKGLLSYVREDGRIPCGVNNFGTATGRSSHRVWVNAPGEKALYGKQIRRCIIAPEGRKLVGVDQKSSQLSIAAFFAKNIGYYGAVAEGSEFKEDEKNNKILHPDTGEPWYIGESAHCHSARNFGIVTDKEWQEAVATQNPELISYIGILRGHSKAASFGVIFGCSGKKLATMLKIDEREGNKRKNKFLRQMGLDSVKDFLEECKRKYPYRGGFYIPLAFGYWVWCKQDHKAINYLIQGTEALAEKLAEIKMGKMIREQGLDAFKVLSMHDEALLECDEGIAEEVGRLAASAFTWAAEAIHDWYQRNPNLFPNDGSPDFKIDLAGGYETGMSYADCH